MEEVEFNFGYILHMFLQKVYNLFSVTSCHWGLSTFCFFRDINAFEDVPQRFDTVIPIPSLGGTHLLNPLGSILNVPSYNPKGIQKSICGSSHTYTPFLVLYVDPRVIPSLIKYKGCLSYVFGTLVLLISLAIMEASPSLIGIWFPTGSGQNNSNFRSIFY